MHVTRASISDLGTSNATWVDPFPHFRALKLCAGAVDREGRSAPVYAPAPSDQLSTEKHMVFRRFPASTFFLRFLFFASALLVLCAGAVVRACPLFCLYASLAWELLFLCAGAVVPRMSHFPNFHFLCRSSCCQPRRFHGEFSGGRRPCRNDYFQIGTFVHPC